MHTISRKALRTSSISCRSQPSSRVGCSICGRRPSPLHQDSGIGSRIDEYIDLDDRVEFVWAGCPTISHLRFRAAASFEHARGNARQIARWIFPVGPRDDAAQPYLPDAADRGRFLPDDQLRTLNLKGTTGVSLGSALRTRPAEPGGPASPCLRRVHRNRRSRLRRLYVGTGKQREIAEHNGHRVGRSWGKL